MLTPYPLEPPPRLPPLDEPWEGDDAPLRSGRRARLEGAGTVVLAGTVRVQLTALVSRRFVALEEPCLVCEIDGAVATSRAVATIALGGGDLQVERSEDGAALWLTRESVRSELLLACRGGTLAVTEVGDSLALEASGPGTLRLIAVAATDETDRDRILRALARKGFGGLRAQRAQHARQIDGLGLTLTSPDPAVDAAFARRKQECDALLEEQADGRRVLPDPLQDGVALLACGLREPVRDVLRGPFDAPELLYLLAAYAQWAGDDEFVHKHWSRVAPLFDGPPGALNRPAVAAVLLPVAEAIGDQESIAMLVSAGGGASTERATPPVPLELAGSWGIVPDGLGGGVALAPALPAAWPEMTLTRLRVGRSTLDARVRRRPGHVAIHCRLTHGPSLLVRLAPVLPFDPTGVLVGDVAVPGPAVQFELSDEVAAVWVE